MFAACLLQDIYMFFEFVDVDIYSKGCLRDALLIYNDDFAVGEVEKRFCGNAWEWEWISTGNNAILELISDSSETYRGFKLNFQSFQSSITAGKR